MQKFKFNFSFLDRFKKKDKTLSADQNPQEIFEEGQDDGDEQNHAYHVETEEIPAHQPQNHDRTAPHNLQFQTQDSEFDSDESPEEFAEKTLGGFNINQYQEELEENNEQELFDENDNEENILDKKINFQETELPSKPEAASKFHFKFPKFNRAEATQKFKNSLSRKAPENPFEKMSWNDFILRLFSPYTRAKIHSTFLVLLVVTLTYMLGKNIALFFSRTPPVAKAARSIQVPLERVDTSLQDINKITATNLFNVKLSDKSADLSKTKDIDSIVCLDAEKPTTTQIKLLDTIVLQDSVKSVASVQFRGNSELMNVREGERIEDTVEVSKIDRMRLILKNLQTGDCEYAKGELDEGPIMPPIKVVSAKIGKALFKSTNPNIKNSGNNFKIKKTFRDSMISNMSEVLTQAKAVQITNPDGSLCFKMTEVVAGSLYSQLNIQENDIICNINGKKIENLNELMGLLGRIKEIDQFQLGLKRNGMDENLEYGFE